VRRGGPVFRWLGEPLAIDLANTVMVIRPGVSEDLLATRRQLADWLEREHERLGDCGFALRHLKEVRELRDCVHRLLAAAAKGRRPARPDVELVNSFSADGPIYLQLRSAAGSSPKAVEEHASSDRLGALRAAIARSTISLLGSSDRERLRICAAPSCGMFFLSKEGQTWCCAACGNRARVARHYGRRASAALGTG
jgi:predicted RNA-binding Zn ribbon-like protein